MIKLTSPATYQSKMKSFIKWAAEKYNTPTQLVTQQLRKLSTYPNRGSELPKYQSRAREAAMFIRTILN